MITNELVKDQPTKLIDFIESQLIDFVRKLKREDYHFLLKNKEVSEDEFHLMFDNLLSFYKDEDYFSINIQGNFNYFTQEMWFSFSGEDDVLPSHNHLKFTISINQPISVSLVLDEFYKRLSEVVKNHLLEDGETTPSILYKFGSQKPFKYSTTIDVYQYLVLDKQD